MSADSPVNTSKHDLRPPIDILDITSDSVTMHKYHIRSGALVLIISSFDRYQKSLI